MSELLTLLVASVARVSSYDAIMLKIARQLGGEIFVLSTELVSLTFFLDRPQDTYISGLYSCGK